MKDKAQKRVLLVIVMASSAFIPFMASAVNIALPSIGRELQLDAVLMSWIATSYLLASTAFILPFGRLADIRGRKAIFTSGLLIFMFASLLAGLSPSCTWLLISRVAQGLATSMMAPTGMALLTSTFGPGERGRALGLNVSAVYIGLSIGPVLGGLLTQWLGWRSIFLIMAPLSLIVLALLWKYLSHERSEAHDERFDFPGAFWFALAITSLLYGFSSLPRSAAIVSMVGGLIALFVFLWRQSRIAHPIVDLALFRSNRTFAMSNLATLLNYSATTAVVFLLSLYLQYIKGFSPRTAGLFMMIQPLVQAMTSPIAGHLSDRMEPQRLASGGMIITVLGLILLSFLDQSTTTLYILFCLLILGLGFGFFSSPNTNAIMSSVEKKEYGIASAMVGAMRQLGQMFSMGLATLILSGQVGRRVITPELHDLFLTSMKWVLQASALFCFFGIFASLARGRLRPSPDDQR